MSSSRVSMGGLISAAALAASLCGAAHGQAAKFVLFGDAIQEAADLSITQQFVHPITSPYFHEDSFVTSDLRAWFLYHQFPGESLIGGGHAFVEALQVRLALTPSVQLVAYKDGFTQFDTPLVNEDGVNDVAAGLKWAFLQDYKNQFHAALGAGFQFPWGDQDILQNDAEVRFWSSINKGFDRLHLGATLNVFLATGDDDALGNSDRLSWHVHADYGVCDWFSPVVEFNGYHIINAGVSPLPFHGLDVGNFGLGEDDPVVAFGAGFEIRPIGALGLRFAWEIPITDNDDDLFSQRITASVRFSF